MAPSSKIGSTVGLAVTLGDEGRPSSVWAEAHQRSSNQTEASFISSAPQQGSALSVTQSPTVHTRVSLQIPWP